MSVSIRRKGGIRQELAPQLFSSLLPSILQRLHAAFIILLPNSCNQPKPAQRQSTIHSAFCILAPGGSDPPIARSLFTYLHSILA